MYGYGRDYMVSTTYDILQRVPQVQLYKYILGYEPKAYMYVKSPTRQDSAAGTWFEWRQGILYHVDFANPGRSLSDCFQVLMDLKGITLRQSVLELAQAFSITWQSPIIFPELAQKVSTRKVLRDHQGSVQGRKRTSQLTEITFKPRAFDIEDREFWFDRYGVRKTGLIEDNVFPIIWYRFYSERRKEWVIIRPNTPSYAYRDFEEEEKVKIYCPFREKGKRFMTNCGADDIGSLLKIKEGPQLVVTKSYKDCRVLRDEGVNAVWLQNEGMFPNLEKLRDLVSPYQEIIVLFDNDVPGQNASVRLQSLLNPMAPLVRNLNVPMFQEPVKDPSDMRYYKGRDELLRFFDLNNIYHNG